MDLFEKVSEDIKTAMKAKDKVALETLRNVKKVFLEAKTAPGANDTLSDADALKIIQKLTKHVNSKRGAELCIAALVSIANFCTANNTIAIITVGPLANDIATRYRVDKRKSASILDTFSCVIQGIIPYGAQMLIAAKLASLSPLSIIEYLYYPVAIGIFALLSIFLRYPRRYS